MLAFEEYPVKVHKNQWLSTCHLPLLSLVGSCCRFALSPFVCHAVDSFRRRASWYSYLCCVPIVIATRSSKAARPERGNNVISARTPTVLIIAFSVISSTKAVLQRLKSRSST